jgi:acetoacetyl-CoA synthetase
MPVANVPGMNPSPAYIPQMRRYREWLARERGLSFDDYDALWRWSVTDLDGFWRSIWDYFELRAPQAPEVVLAANVMPGAQWFPGVQTNYVHQVLRHVDAADAAGMPAIVAENERGEVRELSWGQLRQQVAALATHLRALGVQPGDRVAAYLPNIPEAAVAFLATASLGAVWSICAPDMGSNAVLDRFQQIEPVVLIGADGIRYAGQDHDRREVLQALRKSLPSVRHAIALHNDPKQPLAEWQDLASILTREGVDGAAFEAVDVPFDHPIWVVYSSGTTGLPKPIVHSHGGTLLAGVCQSRLHHDIGASYDDNSWGERFHWYSSTGWVMWNAQVTGLLLGTTCVIFDGSPAGPKHAPDWGTLWRFAARHGVTVFGAGAAFYANCLKAGVSLSDYPGLRCVRTLGSTGSPLSDEASQWGSTQMAAVGVPDVWWCNISGGTDFAAAFVGGNRELPACLGEMQCRMLGCAVEAWSESGQPLIGEVGELVCTQPIPSMPIYFWRDEGGQRYLSSYFDMYPAGMGRQPGGGDGDASMGGVWRHGDWIQITERGTSVIYGRSDATINRHGLRMGTSEIYAAVEALPEVLDSMVVDLEYLGRPSHMPLFVVLRDGQSLDAALEARLRDAIKTALSPRFLPDAIWQVAAIPRTLSGKKQELPIKKLLLGQDLSRVVNPDAMANPECLDWYAAFAQRHLAALDQGPA